MQSVNPYLWTNLIVQLRSDIEYEAECLDVNSDVYVTHSFIIKGKS